jgi:hypothetical protein
MTLLKPLQPGERRPMGYDEWLISNAEAQHIREHNNRATVNGEPVPVYFIADWAHVDAVQVRVPGSGS